MAQLYISGDSYCFYREDPEQHWPARLAENLGLELAGAGYPGQGWWPTRRDLTSYDQLDQVEVFVFCHTDPERVLTDNPVFAYSNPLREQATETWFKYIQSPVISQWCAAHWYRELNHVTQGRRVIHLRGFESVDMSRLTGARMTTPLLKLAVEAVGGDYQGDWGPRAAEMNDLHNHLPAESNRALADCLTQAVTSGLDLIEYQSSKLSVCG